MRLPLIGWAEPAQLTQAAKDLRAACTILDQRGWIQGQSWTSSGVCAGMATWCAAQELPAITEEVLSGAEKRPADKAFEARSVIAQAAFHRFTGVQIPTFNDASGRTLAGVKAKLNEVADEIDKEVAAWASRQSAS